MSFFNINKVPQNSRLHDFEINNFNKQFEDLMMLSKIKTSETITYELPEENKKITINRSLIDPQLAKGKNYINPHREDFIDPNQDSPDRLSLLVLVNKFQKKVLVVKTNQKHNFFIPGGRTKIVESYKNAAIRNFEAITGIHIDNQKVYKLLFAENTRKLKISTYICFVFDENHHENMNENLQWISIKNLYNYNDNNFNNYYKAIYNTILQNLY